MEETKKILSNWVKDKKDTNKFDYESALESLIKDKTILNQSASKSLHFNFIEDEVSRNFEASGLSEEKHINGVLDLVNEYHYYLNMNKSLLGQEKFQEKFQEKNKKKLRNLISILSDNDFMDFLDMNLYLDKTLEISNHLKAQDNFVDVVSYYLRTDFLYSIKLIDSLYKPLRKDSITLKDEHMIRSTILKPVSKLCFAPMSKRAIMKCLFFDLIFYFDDITKEQSIDVIKEFFGLKLQTRKTEDTLSKKAIDIVRCKKDKLYKIVHCYHIPKFDENGFYKKDIPNCIKEIKLILNLKETLQYMLYSNNTLFIKEP